MDKKVILAVAGSGKTSKIIDSLSEQKRSLIITYTNNNYNNLKYKIYQKFNYFPKNITLMTYYKFLYSFCYKPFLSEKVKAKGINYESPHPNTFRLKRNNDKFYLNKNRQFYSNRLSKFLEVHSIIDLIKKRLENYFDDFFIDEIQDFSGNDFNFIKSITFAKLSMTFVGDFYQHTYDTSRDGAVNKTLHDCEDRYKKIFDDIGFITDCTTLSKSYRCSPTICKFITKNLMLNIESHHERETTISYLKSDNEINEILNDDNIIKLIYQNSKKYLCYSQNWGESKGMDKYNDVCIVLNKKTSELFHKNKLHELNVSTRNKLYVACSRTKNNLYFISENSNILKENKIR